MTSSLNSQLVHVVQVCKIQYAEKSRNANIICTLKVGSLDPGFFYAIDHI